MTNDNVQLCFLYHDMSTNCCKQ